MQFADMPDVVRGVLFVWLIVFYRPQLHRAEAGPDDFVLFIHTDKI